MLGRDSVSVCPLGMCLKIPGHRWSDREDLQGGVGEVEGCKVGLKTEELRYPDVTTRT